MREEKSDRLGLRLGLRLRLRLRLWRTPARAPTRLGVWSRKPVRTRINVGFSRNPIRKLPVRSGKGGVNSGKMARIERPPLPSPPAATGARFGLIRSYGLTPFSALTPLP